MVFYAYMLVCSDGSYYTGHTENLEQRVAEHQSGLIRGHTWSRRPVRLVWSQEFGERYEALSAERQIKAWSRAKKEALIDRRWDEFSWLSRSRSALRQAQGEDVLVSNHALETIRAAARAAHPREACGILLGEGARIADARETANVHATPFTCFEIDPQALIDAHRAAREGGPEIVGYFHSHPHGPPEPSETDRAMAAHDGMIWAIAAQGEVRLWRDEASCFRALSYRLSDR